MPTVRVEVVGADVREVDLAPDATYGDLLAALAFSPHEAAVLVDDRPVPEDQPVDFETGPVRVLRLVKGGETSPEVDERIGVRRAVEDDHLDVMRVIDGAALEADAGAVRDRIEAGAVFVATVESGVVGALVREGDRVSAVATRRRWRDRGVGRALVRAAIAGRERLVAEFDPAVRPFYESLGFDVETVDGANRRLRGQLDR